jgi:hypothetical protein
MKTKSTSTNDKPKYTVNEWELSESDIKKWGEVDEA